MYNNRNLLIRISFYISLIAMLAAAFLKLAHMPGLPGEDQFLTIGVMASLVFAVTAIYEIQAIQAHKRYGKSIMACGSCAYEHRCWTVLYFFWQKRIVPNAASI